MLLVCSNYFIRYSLYKIIRLLAVFKFYFKNLEAILIYRKTANTVKITFPLFSPKHLRVSFAVPSPLNVYCAFPTKTFSYITTAQSPKSENDLFLQSGAQTLFKICQFFQ